MGGASISAAAEQVPELIEGLVYVTAALPLDGQTMTDCLSGDPNSIVGRTLVRDEASGCGSVPEEHLKPAFYHLCRDDQVARAKRLLRAWQPLAAANTPIRLSPECYGRIPRCYVECLQDRTITIQAQRKMHAAAGVKAVASLDTDHSPFFSCPAQLAEALDRFVRM
jgi:pimeloyl-ACP methyl ester carboxylesterase